MSYPILIRKEFTKGDYKILPIRDQDKFEIMRWRNDQIDVLRQNAPITRDMQTRYFKEVVMKELKMHKPNQILVSYLCNNILIGYGGLVHINWIDKRGEVSFLLDTDRNKHIELLKKEYAVFLSLIKILAFEELCFNKITTEAFDIRPHMINVLEENGFVLEGRLRDQYFINGRFVDSLLHGCFSKG
jgi:hypothetical protein